MEDRFYTLSAWALLEAETPDISYEFVEGRLVAMSGGTPRHALVKANVATALREALGEDCIVMESDVRVKTAKEHYRLPDVVVVCDPVAETETIPGVGSALTNPVLLVEVLSESTAATDHEDKLLEYMALPSVEEYWLVNPDVTGRVLRFWKDEARENRMAAFTSPATDLVSERMRLQIPVEKLYRQIERAG